MGLDIRLPIGVLFTVFGIVLTLFGALSSPELYQRSLGINVNLIWGVVLLVFGLVMLLLGRRAVRHPVEKASDVPSPAQEKQDAAHV